jgi:UTP--glucose-1-phosphate uridylyltransferase
MQSGLMDQLQREGFEFLFISNVDNLGATLDSTILYHMAQSGIEFLMEVCALFP